MAKRKGSSKRLTSGNKRIMGGKSTVISTPSRSAHALTRPKGATVKR